jgi:lipopolysaccharide/colanic/teichoic acid biosynthesis glycosyltransferase
MSDSAYVADYCRSHPSIPKIDSIESHRSAFFEIIKICADRSLASIALVLLAPVLTAVAIAVYLQSGGVVLFRQTRTGFMGRPFQIYKFCTMTVQENGAVIQQATSDDKRVTPIGRILRKTSIDELPQLLNVIRGEMSFVGPRPHALAHDIYYRNEVPNYESRFIVRPGLTGWAQVNGQRGPTPDVTDMQRRVEFDLWYVKHWTPLLDLKIIGMTLIHEIIRPSGV